MDILVLSDTHSSATVELPALLAGIDLKPDMIIHAGDVTGDAFFDALNQLSPVLAVRGNMDGGSRTGQNPERIEERIEGWRIGIVHGKGHYGMVPDYARSCFGKPDLIIFGHTHVPILSERSGVLMFNPGSLSMPRHGPEGTCGIITVTTERLVCSLLSRTGSKFEEINRHTLQRSV